MSSAPGGCSSARPGRSDRVYENPLSRCAVRAVIYGVTAVPLTPLNALIVFLLTGPLLLIYGILVLLYDHQEVRPYVRFIVPDFGFPPYKRWLTAIGMIFMGGIVTFEVLSSLFGRR